MRTQKTETLKDQNENPFLTLPQVQSYLGIKSRKTILKYIEAGKLAAYKVGGTRWRIAREDVKNFLQKDLFLTSHKALSKAAAG